MKTIAYIDGLNLYYRMLKGRPDLKWLNPLALVRKLLRPPHEVVAVNYYTARLSTRGGGTAASARQAIYLRALSTVEEVRVHESTFLSSEPWMPLARPLQSKPPDYEWRLPPPGLVRVMKSEEKGSDVNLATHLVRDALTGAFDAAVVLTNDTDLVEPIRVGVREAGKRVGLLVPVAYPSKSLVDVASFHLHVRPGHLASSQFPRTIMTADGPLFRPDVWR